MGIQNVINKFSDLLRANMFEVLVNPPSKISTTQLGSTTKAVDSELVSLLAYSTNFPFETITKQDYRANLRDYSIANGVDYDPIDISFYLDSTGFVLDFFQRWKQLIVDDQFRAGYYDEYTGSIVMRMLDRKLKNIFEVTLHEAYPVNRNSIPLSQLSTDTFSELTVNFIFGYATYKTMSMSYTPVALVPLGVGISERDYTPKPFELFNPSTRVYDSGGFSPLSDDFLSFNTFLPGLDRAIGELSNQVQVGIKRLDISQITKIPQIGNLGSSFNSFVDGSKYGNAFGNAGEAVMKRVNELQSKIRNRYEQIQAKTRQRLQTAVGSTLNRIFKF
jgi:hypothetical protein